MSLSGRLVTLVVAGLTLTACSTVPTSSPTVPITQVPTRQEPEVGIEPLAPEPGASPEEIVRGFIDAAASTGRGHPVAREHLTPEAADKWADDAGVTVIESGYATVTTEPGVIRVTAQVVGTVDERGIFTVSGQSFVREYTVTEVEGEQRIANPGDGLVILEPDFERVYDQLNAYFIDPTGERVVPDPRYLVGGEAQPTALVERLFNGPSPELVGAVENPLGGLSLRRAVTVDGSAATVDLTGLPAEPEVPLEAISAQLVWTLEQARIRSVEVLIEGEAVRLPQVPRAQTVDDWAGYDPDAVPVDAVGHYVAGDPGALRTAPEGDPVSGPAGEGAYDLTSAAAAADPASGELLFLAGVSAPGEGGRRRLLAGPYGGELSEVLESDTFTAPTVAATRTEIWTARDGAAVVRVRPGVAPQPVVETALSELGSIEALQLSPDGVRAALVLQDGGNRALYLATVVREPDGAVVLREVSEVNPALSDVVDVAWRTSDTLMVLAADESEDRIVPWEVGVDGWGLSAVATSGLPADATTVAAAPNQDPLVSAGPAGQATIWRLVGGTWVTLVRDEEPFPGTEPFYPL